MHQFQLPVSSVDLPHNEAESYFAPAEENVVVSRLVA